MEMAICQTRKPSLNWCWHNRNSFRRQAGTIQIASLWDLKHLRSASSVRSVQSRFQRMILQDGQPTDQTTITWNWWGAIQRLATVRRGLECRLIQIYPTSVPNLGLARKYCRPRPDCQLWIYGHSWHKPRTLTLLWRAGASDARNARKLLEEETSTLISFQGGPVEQETFSMSNDN